MWKAFLALGGAGVALFAANKFYFSGSKCHEKGRLDGKVAIVTGANSGIGKATAAELARRGARVIMACRNLDRAETAKMDILSCYGEGQLSALTKNVLNSEIKQDLSPIKPNQLTLEYLDLSSLKSVRDFARRICQLESKIDILVNNAGIMACPYGVTEDGFELQMGTNHLGPLLLTELLLPTIKNAGAGARIIFVSSKAHLRAKSGLLPLNMDCASYRRFESYSRSKLANVVYAKHLAKELEVYGIKTASVHPGVVQTELFRFLGLSILPCVFTRPFFKTPWEGAQTTLYTILTPKLVSGAYYADCELSTPLPLALNEGVGNEFIAISRKAVGLTAENDLVRRLSRTAKMSCVIFETDNKDDIFQREFHAAVSKAFSKAKKAVL